MEESVGESRAAVCDARESRRANPRGLLKSGHRVVSEGFDDLGFLEFVTFHIPDHSEVLVDAIREGSLDLGLDVELRVPLSGCVQTTAKVVRGWDEDHGTADVLDAEHESMRTFTSLVAAIEEVGS